MTSFLRSDRSRAVALWLFATALIVVGMVVVGGATRLTGSGLSITQWQPLLGVIPPLSTADWLQKFEAYKLIPQGAELNASITVDQFKTLFWWEWSHRLLGRLLGFVYFIPLVIFLIRRQIPKRLVWPSVGIFILGGLQGLFGWLMVSSGLGHGRVYVAPAWLAVHQGTALLLIALLVWSGLEAGAGQARAPSLTPWRRWSLFFLAGVIVQSMLGALVAGNHAGLVYNDWPLMNGGFFPDHYWGGSLWTTLTEHQGSVQLHHRLGAYALIVAAAAVTIGAWGARDLAPQARRLGLGIGVAVVCQAMLGIATLMMIVPLGLALLHQLGAVAVLVLATAFAWRARRI